MPQHAYQLLDFGRGRKLERFGPYSLDRPSLAADTAVPNQPELWPTADARYERHAEQGEWTFQRTIEPAWMFHCGGVRLELKLTEFGHLGLFPEQIQQWNWIAEQIEAAGRPLKVLNLFAYTGGSTLAAAAAGASVTHVDAANGVVAWARRNAAASELAEAPIRWITDDARKFVTRELKRKQFYDAIVLDPPAYGHGAKGERWKLETHLGELLNACQELLSRDPQFVLLTCHSGELATADGLLKFAMQHAETLRNQGHLQANDVYLTSADKRQLHCGAAMRWTVHSAHSAPRPLRRTSRQA